MSELTKSKTDSYDVMLTTVDNPFDPFEQFDQWFLFDVENGYNSSALLARIARTSDQFTDQENNRIIEQAIDEIILYDFRDLYRKVKLNTE